MRCLPTGLLHLRSPFHSVKLQSMAYLVSYFPYSTFCNYPRTHGPESSFAEELYYMHDT